MPRSNGRAARQRHDQSTSRRDITREDVYVQAAEATAAAGFQRSGERRRGAAAEQEELHPEAEQLQVQLEGEAKRSSEGRGSSRTCRTRAR